MKFLQKQLFHEWRSLNFAYIQDGENLSLLHNSYYFKFSSMGGGEIFF